ncbi:unnamed protein product, partial [Mesorhabditis spiculigera]
MNFLILCLIVAVLALNAEAWGYGGYGGYGMGYRPWGMGGYGMGYGMGMGMYPGMGIDQFAYAVIRKLMGTTMRLYLIGTLIALYNVCADQPVAIGNLAVSFQGKGYKSSPENPLKGQMNDLWCQAQENREHVEIESAKFVRIGDRKVFDAHIDEDQKRAVLIFGNVPVTEAAKYRCEIITHGGHEIFGNMFAYAHPVIHANESLGVYKPDGNEDNQLVAKKPVYANLGQNAMIECPVVGYPHPSTVWYKDEMPIDPSQKYGMRHKGKQLTIRNVQESDFGVYRCKAYNTFAKVVDGPEADYEVSLDFTLKLAGNYGWIYPLIVILIILLLLFIIIYACKAYGKWKSDEYDVAKREKKFGVEEEEKRMVEQI